MSSGGEIILYSTEDGVARIRLRAEDGTVWLSQAEMADLFATSPQNITQHIRSIYDAGEVEQEATCKDHLQVQTEGGRQVQRQIAVYRLEVILAVGYRVRSPRGTQFRRWATSTLRDYLVKGFVLDDERLAAPGEWDYFDELLERIRAIRASEKRFYQKVRDLFALSADYDGSAEAATLFFQTIQNKLLWSVTHRTAAELISERADDTKSNMGLTTFAGPRVRKGDVSIAKNYLTEEEARELDRLVSAFLDLAEDRAAKRQQTTMVDWIGFVDRFLALTDREVLRGAGRISHERMLEITGERYASFDRKRRDAAKLVAEAEYEADVVEDLAKVERTVSRAKRVRKPEP